MFISPELIDTTWKEVGALEPGEAKRRQKRCGKVQPELSGFVLGFVFNLGPDAGGLALYVYLVVLEAFRRLSIKVRKVKPGAIERAWADNREVVAHLRSLSIEPRFLRASPEITAEPAVLQYVIDALTEEDEDPVVLSPDEFWHLFQVLKTAIDCLHDACRP